MFPLVVYLLYHGSNDSVVVRDAQVPTILAKRKEKREAQRIIKRRSLIDTLENAIARMHNDVAVANGIDIVGHDYGYLAGSWNIIDPVVAVLEDAQRDTKVVRRTKVFNRPGERV